MHGAQVSFLGRGRVAGHAVQDGDRAAAGLAQGGDRGFRLLDRAHAGGDDDRATEGADVAEEGQVGQLAGGDLEAAHAQAGEVVGAVLVAGGRHEFNAHFGAQAGQLTEGSLTGVTVTYAGHAAQLNNRPLTQIVLQGLLAPQLSSVNMVNAPVIAKARGIDVTTVEHDHVDGYQTLMSVEVHTDQAPPRAVCGTLFQGEDDSPSRMIARADAALYEAKGRKDTFLGFRRNRGRNRVVFDGMVLSDGER